MFLLFVILNWMSVLAPGRQHIELATAVAEVLHEEAPLFTDDESRVKTASYLVSVAYRESSLRNSAVGDHGRALCMFQLWHTTRDVLTDPKLCTRIALTRLRESIRACGLDNALGLYAAGPGGCTSKLAKRISNDRMWMAKRLAKDVQP
jgi:hypothetical protein